MIWSIAWYVWFRDNPSEKPAVTKEELAEIGPSASAGGAHHGLPWVIAVCTSGIERSLAAASRCARTLLARTAALIYRHHGPQGELARTSTTRGMALWVLVLLLGYLILYFV